MKTSASTTSSALQNFLSHSLFSEPAHELDFNISKTLPVHDLLKQHMAKYIDTKGQINKIICERLLEAIARNFGQEENYGYAYPTDLLDWFDNKLEFEINDQLIQEILFWGKSTTDYEFVKVQKNEEEEFYYLTKEKPLELIPHQTIAKMAFDIIEKAFQTEYRQLKNYILKNIDPEAWVSILNKDESVEQFL